LASLFDRAEAWDVFWPRKLEEPLIFAHDFCVLETQANQSLTLLVGLFAGFSVAHEYDGLVRRGLVREYARILQHGAYADLAASLDDAFQFVREIRYVSGLSDDKVVWGGRDLLVRLGSGPQECGGYKNRNGNDKDQGGGF
jgi:hypothetical protein